MVYHSQLKIDACTFLSFSLWAFSLSFMKYYIYSWKLDNYSSISIFIAQLKFTLGIFSLRRVIGTKSEVKFRLTSWLIEKNHSTSLAKLKLSIWKSQTDFQVLKVHFNGNLVEILFYYLLDLLVLRIYILSRRGKDASYILLVEQFWIRPIIL